MSNQLYISSVQVTFLRPAPDGDNDLFGLWVGDDYHGYQVMEFGSAGEIPNDIEEILHYLYREESEAFELVEQHVASGKGCCFDGRYFSAEELAPILERCGEEEIET